MVLERILEPVKDRQLLVSDVQKQTAPDFVIADLRNDDFALATRCDLSHAVIDGVAR